ncbi:MAG: FAD-dependent oxidoreductase [Chitinispirillaceae bacterium]|nr:FAD-dependent oxidoreductase [Chitinispirillaceae bacterium]
MPPLPPPSSETRIPLPPARALVAGYTDVLVVGAGPAGIGAALGAARSGAKVILAERYGFPGGSATVALVMPFMSGHTQESRLRQSGVEILYPTDHGRGTRVIAGVFTDVIERLVSLGGAVPPSEMTGFVTSFDPEILKFVLADLLDDSDVQTIYHVLATGYIQEEQYTTVFFQSKSGPIAIRAHCVVDCTGDGDIAVFAGASFDYGRNVDHLTQPMTHYLRMGCFERTAFMDYVQKNPSQWYGVLGLWELLQKATKEGTLNIPREDILMFASPHPQEVSVNSTRITGVSGIDIFDLSRAELEGRKQVREVVDFLKRYVPGFNDAYLIQSGVQVGIRETRRIIGDYILSGLDILNTRKFFDVIARSTYPIDIHNPKGKGTRLERLPDGQSYDIPLRCLQPKGCSHLLVAGRCISGTHEAHSSYRVMPVAIATGQGAGVCAALSALNKCATRDVDYKEVQSELQNQKAILW